MSLGLLYTCTCGQRFKVYVPKAKLFRTMTGRTVDWKSIDAEEEAEGDIDDLRTMAALAECTFVDMRKDEQLTCRSCKHQINLLRHFRGALSYSARDLLTRERGRPPLWSRRKKGRGVS